MGDSQEGFAATGAAAFATLYAREAQTVLRYLRTAGGDADAEDLCSETFVRALDAWARFRGDDAAARYWVMRIARNALIDHFRRRGRSRTVGLPETTAAPSPDHARRLAIEAALALLDRDDRELLALRSAGLSYAEISQVLKRSEAAVRKANQRALDRVRPHLEGVL